MGNYSSNPMHSISTLILLILFSGVVSPLHGAEIPFEFTVDEQGHRLDDSRYDLIRKMSDQEKRGLRRHRQGEYADAYALLSDPARHGFKGAQHSLALMHIAGQSVDKNVLVGIALLGLAAESGDRKLEKEYAAAVKSMPEKYQQLVRDQTQYYIQRYGMEAQGVSCNKVKMPDSNLKVMRCLKQPGTYEEYAWAP